MSQIIHKQYARRSLEDYVSPYDDPFEYRTVLDVGKEEVCRLMLPFVDDKTNPDQLAQSQREFQGLVDLAGAAYQPEHWLVAFQRGRPVGVLLPQRYADMPELGTLFTICVLPEFQGRGFGKILHAKGLEVLREMDITQYVGSTEVTNVPMIATFLANGCELTKIHTIQVDELGRHIPID